MSLSAQAPYLWGSEFNDLPKNVWCKNKNKGQSLYSSVWCHYLYKAILLISPPGVVTCLFAIHDNVIGGRVLGSLSPDN
jgi:hypothetical protein